MVKGSGEMGECMTLPGGSRGKGEGKKVQEGDAKERGLNGHDELTLQVTVKSIPNEYRSGDWKKGTGRTTEKKGGNTKKEEPSTRNGSGDGKTAPGHTVTTGKGRRKEASLANTRNGSVKQPDRAGDDLDLDVKDYLHLLKLLKVNLPEGVLSPEVIKLSKAQTCINDAQSIVTELEDFKIQFCRTPRLGCREVKRTLALKNSGNVLQITKTIFFNAAQKTESLNEIWKKNSRNTDRGFRMRDRYKNTPISTPDMYSTAITRTWKTSVPGDNKPKVTDGKSVKINYLENLKYLDESLLDKSGSKPFGMYHQNEGDEMECLKFFHELRIKNSGKEKVQYTKGNTVEYSFLSGRLDFLAHLQQERLVIECKGTTGDMVGKVLTKTQRDDRRAYLVKTHEYFYQTQAYMYILNQDNKLLSRPLSNRAVMVIRHYHKDDNSPQDFYWNELQLDEKIQTDIDELRTYCQREVLACFLAVLDQIFHKEIT